MDLSSAINPRLGMSQDDVQSAARSARAMNHRVLRTVYFDLVGRPPYAAEYERWLDKGLQELLDHLLGEEEFWAHWWEEQLYYFLLIDQFRPLTSAAREVPVKLKEGRLSVRDAVHRIALTSSFDLRNPGADTFVTVVMEQICGMTVQKNTRDLELGKNAYDGNPSRFLGVMAESQSDVISICVEHKKAADHFMRREYARLLKSTGDKKALVDWGRQQRRDPYAYLSIVREWFLSEAYLVRLFKLAPKPNRLFIRGLFVDLLNRLPTTGEMEPMRYALDGLSDARPLRSVLVRLLLDAGVADLPRKHEIEDPLEWLSDQFRRILGRGPSEEELGTFVAVFEHPTCRSETVLYALLSHAEYNRY